MQTFKTKDLPLASVLLTNNLPLKGVEKNGAVCWFTFDKKSECEKLANNYYFGDLMVHARSYQDNLKRLKILIFQ